MTTFKLIILSALFIFNEIGKSLSSYPEVLKNHFNDFIAIPIMLYLVLLISNYLPPWVPKTLNTWHILYTFTLVSVLFEFYLPLQSAEYVGDWIDVMCYALGSSLFIFIEKTNKTHALRV